MLGVSVAVVSAGLAMGMAPAANRSAGAYRGGTSQRTSIVFQVGPGGTRITGVRFGYRLTGSRCRARSASFSRLPAAGMAVTRGRFGFVQKSNTSSGGVRTIRFRGRFISSSAARGSFTVTFANSRGARCRTGSVTYSAQAQVVEFRIAYPRGTAGNPPGATDPGSTHELTFNPRSPDAIWITGQNEAEVVRLGLQGQETFFPMPVGSGPHGIVFNRRGQLWVTLEFAGELVRLNAHGRIVQRVHLPRDCPSCGSGVAPGPHGLAVGPDGRTLWYTGKEAGTIGRVSPDGAVRSFRLPDPDSKPIYIRAGPDGDMWFTELTGNRIGRITPSGHLREFTIPTPGSLPIEIVPDPRGRAMWFSEAASDKIGRISLNGHITEYQLPKSQPNQLLAGLAFDRRGNLWVEQYIDPNHPSPPGPDRLIRIASSITTTRPRDLSAKQLTFFDVPTRNTVMHRIILGPDGNMWFTEMMANQVGRILTAGS